MRKVWLRDDLVAILAGLSSSAGHNRDKRFRAGYQAAIADIALAFGLVIEREELQAGSQRIIAARHNG